MRPAGLAYDLDTDRSEVRALPRTRDERRAEAQRRAEQERAIIARYDREIEGIE